MKRQFRIADRRKMRGRKFIDDPNETPYVIQEKMGTGWASTGFYYKDRAAAENDLRGFKALRS